MPGGDVFEAIRINWFLGVFALEMWAAAWFIAFERDIMRWLRRKWMLRRWHTPAPPPRAVARRGQDRAAW